MKMPEKHDLLAAILAAKARHLGAILHLQWRIAADIMAVRTPQEATIKPLAMCAIIA